MTERITASDVEKVAKLARLRLTDEELQRFTSQLGDVLEHAADLQSLDLDGVAPMAHPVHAAQRVPRRMNPASRCDRDEVLASAPSTEDGQFRVPPVLGEAP